MVLRSVGSRFTGSLGIFLLVDCLLILGEALSNCVLSVPL